MMNCSTLPYFSWCLFVVYTLFPLLLSAQLDADLTTTDNTNCYGVPCNYSGPSILINELMMSPTSNDGSMWGNDADQRGEWIELYNPNICEPIDISCFYLGNNANDSDPYPGGYVIPPGTVIPPAGFAMIRGLNAPAIPANLLVENGGNVVELVVDGTGVCIDGGSRLWFPNSGGWFAFYDDTGVPQDAVSWANQSNLGESPCVPTLSGCGFAGALSNYNNFPNGRKNYILNQSAANFQGQSIRRLPDGGAWSGPGTPTYANCNSDCANGNNSCNGTALATVLPTGGTPPYTYFWDDPQSQTTPTAFNLCAGDYCVLITDALSNTTQQCITVENATYDTLIVASICEGENYTLPDSTLVTTAGQYPILLQTENGCDSTVTVDLGLQPNYTYELNPQICTNDTYTLPNGNVVSQTGAYNSAFQTIHGCDSIYTVNLTVNSPIEITVNAEICAGDSYELPDGTEVTAQGVYDILVAGDPAYCDTFFSVNLSFYPSIEIEFLELNAITCFGDNDGSLSLQVSGGTSPYFYEWSNGIDYGAQATGLEEGDYVVEISDVNGCKADTSLAINEPPVVSLTAFADTLICLVAESNLNANATGGTGGFEYHWSHSNATSSTTVVSPTEDSQYQVFASDLNGCGTDTLTLQVAVIAMHLDSLNISPADSLCYGGQAILSAKYHGSYPPYTYTWSNGLPSTPGPFTVSPESTTSYTVTVSDSCGNEISKNVEIVIWSLPIAEIDTLSQITCYGAANGAAEITVQEGMPEYSYEWSDGQDHGANAEGLIPDTYFVEIDDANGCETSVSFTINEPLALEIELTGDTLICQTETANLLAATTGGTPSISYYWNTTTDSTNMISVEPDVTTVYSVYAIDGNSCHSDTLNITVAVNNMESALLLVSDDATICPGESAYLSVVYAGNNPPYQYIWSNGVPEGTGPHTVSPAVPTTYSLTVIDGCGNMLPADVHVDLYGNPISEVPDILIAGCSPLEVTLYDSLNSGAGYTHEWRLDNVSSYFGNPVEFTLAEAGIYQITLLVTSPNGCTVASESTLPAEVYPLPDATISASVWTTGIDEPEIIFVDESSGAVSTSWTIENTLFENQSQLTYTFADTGYYAINLIAENEYGCRDSIIRLVNITINKSIEIPNAFTPGGSGGDPYYDPTSTSNTVFYPFAEYAIEYQMSVFNRWGELIFESTELKKGWNGTYREELCPQDVYVYKVDLVFADGTKATRVGDVTLFR